MLLTKKRGGIPLELSQYKPRSALVTKTTEILKPRFPVIDAHNHLGSDFGGGWDTKPISILLDLLDEAGVRLYADLDGGWGEDVLQRHLEHFKQPAPERFRVFGGVNWAAWPEHGDGFPEWAAQRLRIQAGWGAEGLKIWKPFGLSVRDHKGSLVSVDDARLDPIWQTAAVRSSCREAIYLRRKPAPAWLRCEGLWSGQPAFCATA